jgi:hypothetical protein
VMLELELCGPLGQVRHVFGVFGIHPFVGGFARLQVLADVLEQALGRPRRIQENKSSARILYNTYLPIAGGNEMDLSPSMCAWLVETANSFHGAQRRRFVAQTVEALDLSQRQAALLLGWARDTVRKGLHELHSGITCLDNFSARGRKPVEVRLPNLSSSKFGLLQ